MQDQVCDMSCFLFLHFILKGSTHVVSLYWLGFLMLFCFFLLCSPPLLPNMFNSKHLHPPHPVSWTLCLSVTLPASIYSHLNCDSVQPPMETHVWVRILLSSHSQSWPLPLCRPLRRFSSSVTTPPQPAPPHQPPRWPLERGPRALESRSRWPGQRSVMESRPSHLVQPHRRESKTSSIWSRECSQIPTEAVLKTNYTSNLLSRQLGGC